MEAQLSEYREMLLTCFNGISDPRGSNARHPLQSVLFIALCAVISGAESWDDIELYALSKKEWLISMSQLIKGMVAWSSDVVELSNRWIGWNNGHRSKNFAHSLIWNRPVKCCRLVKIQQKFVIISVA